MAYNCIANLRWWRVNEYMEHTSCIKCQMTKQRHTTIYSYFWLTGHLSKAITVDCKTHVYHIVWMVYVFYYSKSNSICSALGRWNSFVSFKAIFTGNLFVQYQQHNDHRIRAINLFFQLIIQVYSDLQSFQVSERFQICKLITKINWVSSIVFMCVENVHHRKLRVFICTQYSTKSLVY